MSSKLNWLLSNTIPGGLVLQSWLSAHNISSQLARKYVQSNWLIRQRAGVYIRPGRSPQWQDAVHCLIAQNKIPIRLIGLTSLTLQGKSQYLQSSNPSVWLGVPAKVILPRWFRGFPESTRKQVGNEQPKWNLITMSKNKPSIENNSIEIDINGTRLPASNLELAIFEVLDAIPKLISFDHAAELYQGLVNLSPRKVQSLLQNSSSIKASRLFLFLADFYQMPWRERLDESKIDLGSGNRKIVTGGKLDKRYQITVPAKYMSRN